jgi:hypothetical protein
MTHLLLLLLPLLLLLLPPAAYTAPQGDRLREFLRAQGAVVTTYQDGIPPPNPGHINVMIVGAAHVMQQGLEGTQLPLPRHLVNGMHVVTDVLMKLFMAQPQQVRGNGV